MATRINDLEILLTIKNEGEKALGDLKKDLKQTDKFAMIARRSLTSLGGVAATSFVALANRGSEVALELQQMGSLLGIGTREADALLSTIQSANPAADIDKITEATLTLGEAFFDAKAESGPLFDLIKDFKVDLDLGTSGSRQQLAEFLRVLQQIPEEGDRASAAIAVLGGDDAKPFIKIARDAGLLKDIIVQLGLSIEDIPDIFTEEESRQVDEFVRSGRELAIAYDELSAEVFGFVSGPMAASRDMLTQIIESLDTGLEKYKRFAKELRKETDLNLTTLLLGAPGLLIESNRFLLDKVLNDGTSDTADGDSISDSAISNSNMPNREVLVTGYGTFSNTDEFKKWRKAQQSAIDAALAETPIEIKQDRVDNINVDGSGDVNNDKTTADYALFYTGMEEYYTSTRDSIIQANYDIANSFQQTKSDALIFADALGGLEGALSQFSNAALTKGTKAFRRFQILQVAAATASAYSAASQALAGYDSATAVDRFGKAVAVLGVGLGYAAKISSLLGGGGSQSPASAPNEKSNFPQAPAAPNTAEPQREITVNIRTNTPNQKYTISEVQEILEVAASIPGSAIYKLNEVNF